MARPAAAEPTAKVWGAVAALCLIQFIDVMSVTVVITALPQMLTDSEHPPVTAP